MNVLALITDLFFVAKVKGTADVLGVPLGVVRTAEQMAEALTADLRLAIIDLNAAGTDPLEAIRTCKSRLPALRVLAYMSHVQKDLAEAARRAGADEVLPRSRFSLELPQILSAQQAPG